MRKGRQSAYHSRKWVSLPKTHAYTHVHSNMLYTCFELSWAFFFCFFCFFSKTHPSSPGCTFKSSPVSQRPLRHQHFRSFSTVCWFVFSFFFAASQFWDGFAACQQYSFYVLIARGVSKEFEFPQKKDRYQVERLWKCSPWMSGSNNVPEGWKPHRVLYLFSYNCRKYWSFTCVSWNTLTQHQQQL